MGKGIHMWNATNRSNDLLQLLSFSYVLMCSTTFHTPHTVRFLLRRTRPGPVPVCYHQGYYRYKDTWSPLPKGHESSVLSFLVCFLWDMWQTHATALLKWRKVLCVEEAVLAVFSTGDDPADDIRQSYIPQTFCTRPINSCQVVTSPAMLYTANYHGQHQPLLWFLWKNPLEKKKKCIN